MKRLSCVLFFSLFSLLMFGQKNWNALKVGGDGAKYKATLNTVLINQTSTSKKDTTTTEKTIEFIRRFIDSDNKALFAELEFTKIGLNSQYELGDDLLNKKAYFKLNKQGGSPEVWDAESSDTWIGNSMYITAALSVGWSFFNFPNKKLKNGLKWKVNFPSKEKELESIGIDFKVTGKIDTLGHKCVVVTASKDFLETLKSDPKFAGLIEKSENFKGKMIVEYKLYIDKKSGLLVYGKSDDFLSMSMKLDENPMLFETSKSSTIVLLPEKIMGLKKTINKFSPKERLEQKLNAERSAPPVVYDFNKKLEVILPLKFHQADVMKYFRYGYSSVKIDDKWRIIDTTGQIIPDFFSDKQIGPIGDYFTSYSDGDVGLGLKTIEGKEVLPPEFESIGEFKPGVYNVSKAGKIGYFNEKGEEILPLDYYSYSNEGNDCALSTSLKREKMGTYYNTRISLPKGYKIFKAEHPGFVSAKKDSLIFLFDCSGNLLFEKPIESFNYLNEQFFTLQFSGDDDIVIYEILQGKPVKKQKVPRIDFNPYGYGEPAFYPFFAEKDKVGLFDKNFEIALKPGDYHKMKCTTTGCFFKFPDEEYGIFNLEKEIIPLKGMGNYNMTDYMGYITYYDGIERIYLSKKGESLLKKEEGFEFSSVEKFANLFIKEKSSLYENGENSLVSSERKILTEKTYHRINQYAIIGDFFPVENEEGKYGLIHKSGREIATPQFDQISSEHYFENELFVVKNNEKYGMIDNTGELILPTEFEQIKLGKYGMIWVKMNDKVGLVHYLK